MQKNNKIKIKYYPELELVITFLVSDRPEMLVIV